MKRLEALVAKLVGYASGLAGVWLVGGVVMPFVLWSDAARSIVDMTIHGHLGRPGVLPWAVLFVLAAAGWVISYGRFWPSDADCRWCPSKSWVPPMAALALAAGWMMLVHGDTPGPGARDTGRTEFMCDDYNNVCDDVPILEAYRWGKPFLSRAELENIQHTILWLASALPAALLVDWQLKREEEARPKLTPEERDERIRVATYMELGVKLPPKPVLPATTQDVI